MVVLSIPPYKPQVVGLNSTLDKHLCIEHLRWFCVWVLNVMYLNIIFVIPLLSGIRNTFFLELGTTGSGHCMRCFASLSKTWTIKKKYVQLDSFFNSLVPK